jgi:hypothetical protein
MMVFYNRDYRLSGLCPLSNILKEHKVPETGFLPSSSKKVGRYLFRWVC